MTISDRTCINASNIFKGLPKESEVQNSNAKGGITITKEERSQSMLKIDRTASQKMRNNELKKQVSKFLDSPPHQTLKHTETNYPMVRVGIIVDAYNKINIAI